MKLVQGKKSKRKPRAEKTHKSQDELCTQPASQMYFTS